MSREVFYTPDEQNAWIGSFAGSVSQFPVVGPLVASFITPSMTANYVKDIDGKVIDARSGWEVELALFKATVLLIALYIIIKRF
jgi:hypothetical protein